MTFQYGLNYGRQLTRSKIDQSQNPPMRAAKDDGQFTEILIQGDENAGLQKGFVKNCFITGVGVTITNPDDIMIPLPQSVGRSGGNTGIQK